MKSAKAQRSDLDWPTDAGVTRDVVSKIREKARVFDARRNRRIRRVKATAAALVLATFAGGWGVSFVRDTDRVATVAAGREIVTLRDGSVAEMNARTQLRTDFRWGRRQVRMDSGEAYFSVAKDAEHPFLVETPRGTIRVTGTEFNVRLTADAVAEVTLIEGGVIFDNAKGETLEMTPGQQLRAGSDVEVRPLSSMDHVLAWREGRLVFDGLTLGQSAERLASFHGTDIAVAPQIAGLRANGSVGIANLAGALDALQVLLPIRILGSSESGYRIVAR